MRSAWLVTGLFFMATACESGADCRSYPGVDAAVPERVKTKVAQEGLGRYTLVDKVDCKGMVYWTAIPPEVPANVPRPPGFGLLVSLDMNSQAVSVEKGR